jgi:DNA-binding beta-propeller fold protein YncE
MWMHPDRGRAIAYERDRAMDAAGIARSIIGGKGWGMVSNDRVAILPILLLMALMTGATATRAQAEEGPVKLVPASHMGREVDKITKNNVCLVESKHECQPGRPGGEPGEFEYPQGAAGAPAGNVYVADRGNHRVQELSAAGEFVLMFGKEVNATTHGDVCTEEEIRTLGVTCQTGVTGAAAGALAEPQSVAVDQSTGNVYVQDRVNWRIAEYTGEGQFVLMFGKEVDQTKDGSGGSEAEKNVCTAASKDICRAGVQGSAESLEPAAFNFEQGPGDLLAVGGPEHFLYVGDDHRVQSFDPSGTWKGEIRLSSGVTSSSPDGSITAIAIDGNIVYLVYQFGSVIHQFDATTGEELATEGGAKRTIDVAPRREAGTVEIRAIAIDTVGRLAVSASEAIINESSQFGSLYEATNGHLLTGFGVADGALQGVVGMGFNGSGELFVVVRENHEVVDYSPKPVAEVITSRAACSAGPEEEGSDTFDCYLHGEVNPYSVPGTDIWFEWGRTCGPSLETVKQMVEPVKSRLQVSALVNGLRPNETFCYRLVSTDQNVQLPEMLTGEDELFRTPVVPPRVVGEPTASFIKPYSAVLHGELNPENARAEYLFEYAPDYVTGEETLANCPGMGIANCSGVAGTTTLESKSYGLIGATLEASGLQPNTSYRYRLMVRSGTSEYPSVEGSFTTESVPVVHLSLSSPSLGTDAPSVLVAPSPIAMLPSPGISFPKTMVSKAHARCKRGYTRNKQRRCVRSKSKRKLRSRRNVKM